MTFWELIQAMFRDMMVMISYVDFLLSDEVGVSHEGRIEYDWEVVEEAEQGEMAEVDGFIMV